jgi:hypothetical protein
MDLLPKRRRTSYTPWSTDELEALERGFASNFVSLERPVKKDFEAFMLQEGVAMWRRGLKNVRDAVQSRITKLKRMHRDNH